MKALLMCCILCVPAAAWSCAAQPAGPADGTRRIVFLGDSITDGNTYPLLVGQALSEAGRPVPALTNAAIAGNMATDMRKRLERDVLVHKPDIVVFHCGANDVHHAVPPADCEKDVRAIAERLAAEGVRMVILTTCIMGPQNAEKEKMLLEYNAVLRRIAQEHGWPIGPVYEEMDKARAEGRTQVSPDGVHLEFDGYLVMTRAVLDGLGYPDVPVPKELAPEVMPGIIRQWRMCPATQGEPPLNAETVKALQPDDAWTAYALPEPQPLDTWWPEQERRRGFAQSLDKLVGPGGRYFGVASLDEPEPRQACFNTGAQLQTVWLNGEKVFQVQGWTGWHAGKERITVHLPAGRNTVVIECGPSFFLSVTDDNAW